MGLEACEISIITNLNLPQAMRCSAGLLGILMQFVSEHLIPIVIPAILVMTSVKLWKFYTSGKDPECDLPLPPGNMGWPVIGETLSLMAKGSDFFRERSTSFGNVYKTHILGQPTIRVTGAKNVAKILKGEGTLVTSKWPVSTRLILGEGALAHSAGDVHRWRRELVMRAFSPQAIKSYMPSVQTLIREHVRKWCDQGDVMGYPAARSLTFTVAAQLLLGFDVQERQKYQMLILFEDMLATLFSMPLPVPGIGLYRGLKARKRIMAEIEECITRRRALPQDQQADDALAVMLRAADNGQGRLTPREMQDSALEMLFAGHLPTSSAACSCLMYLGANPKVVGKLTVELYDHGLLDIQDHPDLSLEAIDGLQYLDNVVREILRVAPPVGAGYRKALQTFEIDGCQVPKGWTVVYSIRETQHTSDMFNADTTFDPDRWGWFGAPKSSRQLQKKAEEQFDYVPFGFGDRSCVGQRFVNMFLKVLIVELVRNASWRLESSIPDILYMPVPHPKDNLPLQFKHMPPDLRRRAFTNQF